MKLPLSASDAKWVEKTLSGMTVRQKIGQVMMARLTPNGVKPYGMAGFVERFGIGGGHTFGGELDVTRKNIGEAQSAAEVPLLISGDLESGAGQAITGLTEFAGQLALGACRDEKLAYRFGEGIAVEGTAAGYNWAFGPVVDLSIHPGNLSNIRCLGAKPQVVGRLAAAIIRGIQDHGMIATAKHFPGGGLDDLDAHLTVSVNPLSRKKWMEISAVPFQAAIRAGVWSVMASPKACPGIDPECGDRRFPRPIMVSHHGLNNVLRGQLGFEGLIVTDAVTMGGLTMHFRRMEMLRACFNAGNDMLLFVRDLNAVFAYFERCLLDGTIREERLEDAVRRVLTLKARIGLHRKPALISDEKCRRVIARSPYGADAERLSRQSITLLRDDRKVLPLKLTPGLRVGSVLITNRVQFNLDVFERTLREAGCQVTPFRNPGAEEMYDCVERGDFDVLTLGLYYPPQWGWGTDRCHGPESRCMMSGFPFANPAVSPVFISWANPYHLYEFAFMDPYLNAYGGAPMTQKSAALALLGKSPIVGKSPVELPGFFKIGDGLRR
jgi:beta-N-acetylhexosaminidase